MGKMERVPHLSNADIVWFLVDFKQAPPGEPFRLEVEEEFYTTLESATLGLRGGVPVSQGAFEDRIRAKARNQALSGSSFARQIRDRMGTKVAGGQDDIHGDRLVLWGWRAVRRA